MTGPEHYREAERLLNDGVSFASDDPTDLVYIAAAHVHAMLALAAATIETNPMEAPSEWFGVVRPYKPSSDT